MTNRSSCACHAAAEVIIGNPTIADVSVQGGNLLVVTGKSFGVTNIISL
jgi:Flp pilus assembly secretin CpaC